MIVHIADVLDKATVAEFRATIAANPETFADGATTAGWHAKPVKRNEQATGGVARELTERAARLLLAHPLFKAAASPKRFVKILVSRYRPGMSYGTHVDDALMSGIRTDLSFTLFLSDMEDCDGGALVVEGIDGDNEVKLPAGSLVLYPTTTLHRVSEVTRGERLAIVGWVRSFIRGHDDREVLFDLENIIATLRQQSTPRETMNRILKVKANLLRKWADD